MRAKERKTKNHFRHAIQNLRNAVILIKFSNTLKRLSRITFKSAKAIYNEIDLNKLGWKKTILLELPNGILKFLVGFKSFLAKIGLAKSVFR